MHNNARYMDKTRPPRTNRWFRYATISSVVGIAALVAWWQWGSADALVVPQERLVISTVAASRFYDYLGVNATVTPRETYYIDSKVSGHVAEVWVESGSNLAPGTPLLRLTNDELQLEVLQREAQLIEQLDNQRQTRLLLNQNHLRLQEQLTEIDYQITLQRKQYDRNQQLYDEGVISAADFEPIDEGYRYYRRREVLLGEAYRTDSLSRAVQLSQIDATERRITRHLGAVQQLLDRLSLRAPVGGRLGDFTVQVGEAVSVGQRLGQIYSLDNPDLVAEVDEYYLDRVALGQSATAIVQGDTALLTVHKIDPAVRDGRFGVTLRLQEPDRYSAALTKGQTVRLRLQFGAPTVSTLLPTGSFYSMTGGNWVYVTDGRSAIRRPIQLGRKNADYYEVLEGLSPGERVITSDYTAFGEYATLELAEP